MVPLVMKIGALAVAAAVLGEAFDFGDSSCLTAKTAEQCRGRVEEGSGDPCVWCTCKAIPSECLGSTIAKVDREPCAHNLSTSVSCAHNLLVC